MTLFVLLALIACCGHHTSLAGAISSADTTLETTSQKQQNTNFSAEITSLPDLQRPTNPTEDVIGIHNSTEITESLEEEIDEYADYDYNFNATEQIQNKNLSRILPENAAAVGDFPFSAFVEGTGSSYFSSCTGALISLRFVLVPASCVDGVSSISVRLEGKATTDGTALTATKIMHPKYKTYSKDYNIALLRLSPTATASATVSPIELAPKSTSDDNKDIAGLSMTVIGYGPLVVNGALDTKVLRSVQLNVLGKSECLQLFRTTNFNVNSNVPYSSKQSCLGTSETRGLCGREDMGAPVFQGTTPATFRLYGFVTYINSCTSSIPALFTRIGPYYDWITKVMRNSAF